MNPTCNAPGCHDTRTRAYGFGGKTSNGQHSVVDTNSLIIYLGDMPGLPRYCRIHALQTLGVA